MNKKSMPFFVGLIIFAVCAWFFLQHGLETGKQTLEKSKAEEASSVSSKEDGEEAEKTPATPPAPIDPTTVGIVRGSVLFEGIAPPRKVISFSGFADCKALQTTPPLEESLVVENGKIRNAIVSVRKGLEGRKFPLLEDPTAQKPAVLDQVACIYTPHVLALRAGQLLEIHNSDPLPHNVHSDSVRNRDFNEPMSAKGKKLEKRFNKEETFSFRCDIHGWMRSYVSVFTHPFYAVTGDDGTFAIPGLPPGKYTLRVWHELLGTQDVEIELGAKEEKTVDFKLKSK